MKAAEKEEVENVIHALDELQEDATIPKNIKQKLQEIANVLQEDTELSLRLNKALNEMDEIANDINIEPFTRTQIWNIVSMLEGLNS